MSSLIQVICLLLSICGVLGQFPDSMCDPDKLERCTHNMRSLYNSQDGPVILRNEAELVQMCNQQQSMLSCINNYVETCMLESMKNIFKNMTIGVEEFVRDYCIGNSYSRQIYLKHLSCYNAHLNKLNRCAKRHQEWNRDVVKSPARKVETTRKACCLYDDAMYCQKRVILNECPREGSAFFDGMVEKATRHFNQIGNCDQFMYALSECSGGVLSTSSPSLYSVFLGSAILVIINLFSKFW